MLNQPFFIPSVVILVMTIPLILGLMPRNRIYGIRTAKTLADDAAWYRANRFGGWAILISSLIYLAVAFLVPDVSPSKGDLGIWLLHLASFIVPLSVSILLIRWYIKNS